MKHHGRHKPSHYEARFEEYVDRELHPETAANLKEMVWHSPVASAELVMSVILQMQLDHVRKDQQLETPHFEYNLADKEGEALDPNKGWCY